MKTIILLINLLFFSITSYSQIRDTVIKINNSKVFLDYDISWDKQKLQKNIDDFIKNYKENSLKASSEIKTILNQIPLSQDACLNGGFENGYTDWTGLSLKHSLATIPIENGIKINPGIWPLGFNYIFPQFWNVADLNPGNSVNLQGIGWIPELVAASPSINLPMVKSGNQSIKLGNDGKSFGAEGIAKRFKVVQGNANFKFQYSLVMDSSHTQPLGGEAFFIAEAVDITGNTIDKIVEVGSPDNPFIKSTNNGLLYYRNWRCCSLDLSSHVGQEVVVMFINSDCSQGAHRAYTYLDAVCEPCSNTNEGDINISLNTDNCLILPQTIGGTFTLPISGLAQNRSISLQIFQNNVLKGTIINPVITGSNYSFTINPSDFPNQTNGQCYDLVSILSFDYPDMNSNLQNVTHLSSNPVMGIQDGSREGLNNDVCFCSSSEPCCNIDDLVVSLTENNGTFSLNLNGGSKPIQEVEVSMLDYHAVYNEPDCRPVNMGNVGSNIGYLTTTTTSLSTLSLNTSGNNSHILNWLPGTPAIINSQINFTVKNPAVLNLVCCNVKLYFCIKVRVKDIDCNVCEKILCYPSGNSCDCIGWSKKYANVGVNPQTPTSPKPFSVICGGTISFDGPKSLHISVADFNCSPTTCTPTYKWKVQGPGAINVNGTGKPFDFDFSAAGTYNVTITPYCGNKVCESCSFTVIIKGTVCDCNGQGWIKGKPVVIQSNADQSISNVNCNGNLQLNNIGSYLMTAPGFYCNPANCPATYSWQIQGPTTSGNMSGKSLTYSFPTAGTYYVTITPNCGNQSCSPCKFTIAIKPLDCKCAKWTKTKVEFVWKDPKQKNEGTIECNSPDPFTIPLCCYGQPITGYFGTYDCYPADCQVKYDWIITDSNNLQVGIGNNTSSTNYSFIPTIPGTYTLKVTPVCGNYHCEPCVVKIVIQKMDKCN